MGDGSGLQKKPWEDWRESPAIEIMHLLQKDGITLTYHDPYVAEVQVGDQVLLSVELTESAVTSADMVLITTDHTGIDYGTLVQQAKAVLDTRGVTPPS